MKQRFWIYVYGNVALLFIPMLLIVSWINVYIANTNYNPGNYFLTFVLPTFAMTFVVSLVSFSHLARKIHYTAGRILFTLFGLITTFVLIRYGVAFFGFDPLFITLRVPQAAIEMKHYSVANQYYSFSVPFSLTMTFILYQLSSLLLTSKRSR